MLERIVIAGLVAVVVAIGIRSFYRTWTGRDTGGCGGCAGCPDSARDPFANRSCDKAPEDDRADG